MYLKKNINQQDDNLKDCNCWFEKKRKLIDCDNINCKYKMCLECYYEWYINNNNNNNNNCPHCRKKQVILFDNYNLVINIYDGYYLKRFYLFFLGILLLIILCAPVFIIYLIFTNNLIYFLKFISVIYFIMNPISTIIFLIKLVIKTYNLVIKFHDYVLNELSDEIISLF